MGYHTSVSILRKKNILDVSAPLSSSLLWELTWLKDNVVKVFPLFPHEIGGKLNSVLKVISFQKERQEVLYAELHKVNARY